MNQIYRIEIVPAFLGYLRREFKEWGIDPESYAIEGSTIVTNDKDVVDVITETFMNMYSAYKILNTGEKE